ncbi:hypothetical protein ES705_37609 [subsurface metagenome]
MIRKKRVVSYDEETDVLYISFHNPPLAADFTNRRDDFIFRSKEGEPVGVTIMNFSRYAEVIKLIAQELGYYTKGGG